LLRSIAERAGAHADFTEAASFRVHLQ
jgi:hypothetical protein